MGKALYQMKPEGRALRLMVLALVMFGLVLPILAGAAQTLGAAFGWHSSLTGSSLTLAPWQKLFSLPGFMTSLRLTLITAIGSTALALLLAIGLSAGMPHPRLGGFDRRLITPVLAMPHAAMAIGLAFLIAPAGWLARLISSLLGWQSPPEIASVNDSAGMALLLGLCIKELPFLFLVVQSALTQIPAQQHIKAGRALGYSLSEVWLKIIMPQLWPLIRLPVLVVQAYALASVDMAIILGPSNPPTLAVAITRWLSDPDLTMIYSASAAAVLLALITGLMILLWSIAARSVAALGRIWLRQGQRGKAAAHVLQSAALGAVTLLMLGILSLLALMLWSFAYRWSFPMPLPESWTLRSWAAFGTGWGRAAGNSLLIGLLVTGLSTALAVAWLEAEDRGQTALAGWAHGLIYLPLLLPQLTFLYGLNQLFLQVGLSGSISAVIWAQAFFVFPYIMIALTDPWRALDPALIRNAASLGAGPNRRLVAVKLPVLLGPLLTAAAIGFAVSIAQYLPTLFMGAGRVTTLTTEAVTLSSGSDRRLTGTMAAVQAVLPLLAYGLAISLPRVIFRNRRALVWG